MTPDKHSTPKRASRATPRASRPVASVSTRSASRTLSPKDLQDLFSNMKEGFAFHQLVTDEAGKPVDYVFLSVNEAFKQMTGLTDSVIGQRVTQVIPGITQSPFDWISTYGTVALTGKPVQFEQYFDAHRRWYNVSAYCPRKGFFAVVFTDVTERRQVEAYLRLSHDVLQVLNGPERLRSMVERVLHLVKSQTECDAIGLRLRNDRDFPYFASQGFPLEFLLRENELVARDRDGNVCIDREGNIDLECTCGLVISGRTDPWNPLFTPGGSFWTNNSSALLDLSPAQDPRLNPRNRCILEGFMSIALVPVRSRKEIVGLLQINFRAKDRLLRATVEALEGVACQIGEALMRKQMEETLLFRDCAIDCASQGICITDRTKVNHPIVYVNHGFELMTGYTRADLIGRSLEILQGSGTDPKSVGMLQTALMAEVCTTLEMEQYRKDGTPFWSRFSLTPVRLHGGLVTHYVSVHSDITDERRDTEQRRITTELLRVVNSNSDLIELMRSVTNLLQEWSGCEAVGIRLREGEDFPYYVTSGFPARFVEAERFLCARDPEGQVLRDAVGNPVLECMCGNILCGRFDPAKPFFTARGSFWSNGTTELLASTTETDRQARTRNRCNGEGYESVALIRLRSGDETIGLLQLNDRHRNCFSLEKIVLLEGLADSVALALVQRRADEQLKEQKTILNRFFESPGAMRGVIELVDGDLVYVTVNAESARFFGRSQADTQGRRASELGVPGPVIRHWVKYCEQTRQTDHPVIFEYPHKTGERHCWFSVTVSCMGRGSPGCDRFAFIVNDITDRVRAEISARRVAEDLRKYLEIMESMILVLDPGGRVTLINRKGCEILGCSPEDAIGASWFGSFVPVSIREAARARFAATLSAATDELLHFESAIRTKAGEERLIAWHNTVLSNEMGVVTGLLCSCEDVTDHRRLQDEHLRQRQALAHADRLATMNELAAALAHELNQPLTGILSNAQAAQRLLALHPPDLGEASDALADIVADNKRAGEIIRRARALLKRDSSTREPVDMNALIRGVLEIVHSELVMNDVGVETNLGEALPPVVGDPVQLQQVMINLVMNAAQAVSTQPAVQRKVWIATARDSGDQTRVSVRDFGPGISKEQASVLFEPLYTTRKDGLGLGLPICRTIITAHRGQIWAENSPGGGLIVSFTLPSKEENPNG